MKALLIIHGRSRLKDVTLRTWLSLAEAENFELKVSETQATGDAQASAENAQEMDLVIACGGDGTNHEVVNGLMKLDASERPVLSTIAAGSGNDFARIRQVASARQILNAFTSKRFEHIPLLQLSFRDKTLFGLNMSTVGIGAEIARQVNKRKYKIPPALNYYSSILAWLARYKAPSIELKVNGSVWDESQQPFLLAVGNGSYAGNGLGLCPQASLKSEELALTVIGNVGVLDFLRYQQTLQRCEQVQDARVHYMTTPTVDIEVKQGPFSLEVDGEFISSFEQGEKISYSKIPSAIRLI